MAKALRRWSAAFRGVLRAGGARATRARLEALSDLAVALSGALNAQEVGRIVVERGAAIAGADSCTLFTVDDDDGALVLIGHRGIDPDVIDRIRRIPASARNPAFATTLDGRAVWAETEEDYRAFDPDLAAMRSSRAKAFWCVPFLVEGRTVGLLGMGFYEERRFPAEERAFVRTFANHCAQALRRSQRLERELQAHATAERLRASLETTLRSIGDAVITTDSGGRITLMNPNAEALTGWAEQDARGRPLEDVFRIVDEYTREPASSPVAKVLRDGHAARLANHTLLLSRTGAETAIADSGAPIRGDDGKATGVVIVFRDVSAERREDAKRAFLIAAGETLASSLDPDQTLTSVAELAVPTLADWCAVHVLEGDVPKRVAVAHVDPAKVALARELAQRYPPDSSTSNGISRVIRTGQAELHEAIPRAALEAAARDAEHLRLMLELDFRSAIVVPLRAHGATLGAVTFVHAESGRRYAAADVAFAEDLARRAALALENARWLVREREARRHATQLYEQTTEQARINAILVRMAASLASELDADRLVQTVTDEATALCRAQFGSFFYNVQSEAGERYTLYTLSGVPRDAFSRFPQPRNTPIFEPTFHGTGVVRSDDITKDPRYGQMDPHRGMPPGHLPVRSYLAVPVKSRSGQVLGGLFFGHANPGIFTPADEALISGVAGIAGIALDNARLFQAASRAEAEARKVAEERARFLESERAARLEAERANRAKDEFLATVSHELRTPLNAILGWTRMLRTRSMPEDRRARALETIDRNALAQTQLIEDLLDIGRIMSGKLRLNIEMVDLRAVVDAATDSVRPAANARQVELLPLAGEDVGPIEGDSDRLLQIVWNLLSNAVKFTPRGGRVTTSVRRSDSHVEIEVADTGQGIETEFLPFVFERFRQADASTTRAHGGLGLGLAIVRHLVELHGGAIEAHSDGAGKGATFRVSLPIAARRSSDPPLDAARPTPTASGELPTEALEGLAVLVVDDDADTRDLLRSVLEDYGARVMVAPGAVEAFARLEEQRPDVVVSDIGMPDEDGYSLVARIRALPPERGGRTVAIALTAYSRGADRSQALVSGFDAHVPKPVEPVELVAMIASMAPPRSAMR